jgi:hypothetical protein
MRVVLTTMMEPLFDGVFYRAYKTPSAIIAYIRLGFPAF